MSKNGMSQNGKWTPDRIRRLRKKRGQTQTEFGLDLYACGESDAQVRVSRLRRVPLPILQAGDADLRVRLAARVQVEPKLRLRLSALLAEPANPIGGPLSILAHR